MIQAELNLIRLEKSNHTSNSLQLRDASTKGRRGSQAVLFMPGLNPCGTTMVSILHNYNPVHLQVQVQFSCTVSGVSNEQNMSLPSITPFPQ